mmetsp:Transcript_24148/g.42897  ORF Transcript_24148/g.42897 Transcript_24148/m.42897 type:complete len:219 (+) Transcript_24148:183-839(+)
MTPVSLRLTRDLNLPMPPTESQVLRQFEGLGRLIHGNDLLLSLEEAYLVRDVKGIVVWCKFQESFLLPIWTNQGVDFGDLDAVEFLCGFLDLLLVGSRVYEESDCVVVVNQFHGSLSRQRLLNDRKSVKLFLCAHRLASEDWSSMSFLSFRPAEVNLSTLLVFELLLTRAHSFSYGLSLGALFDHYLPLIHSVNTTVGRTQDLPDLNCNLQIQSPDSL